MNCDKVCFTTWDDGFKKEGCWEWNITSVIVFGRAKLIEDKEMKEDRLRKLALKYYPTKEEVEDILARSFDKTQLFCIDIEAYDRKVRLVKSEIIANIRLSDEL
jgi:nitroimidazol reductase NimA-like FMN-containing flavoprotein (pyridoxamine 5'-phosphate oxidase superfamily)